MPRGLRPRRVLHCRRETDSAARCRQTAALALLDRRNEALRHQRERRREEPTDMLTELVTTEAGPETLAARSELADLVPRGRWTVRA